MNKAAIFIVLLAVGVLIGGGCGVTPQGDLPAVATDNPIDTYLIAPGDVLSIDGGKNPDVSKEQIRVNEEGNINLIYIGKVKAAGLTKSKLEADIDQRYRDAGQFADSQVSIAVLTLAYYVDGQVQNRGQKGYVRQITLYQAIVDAGGFTEYANKAKVRVLRPQPDGSVKRYVINVKRVMSGHDPDSFVVRPNDTIFVPRGY